MAWHSMTEERQIDYDALLHEAFRDAQRGVMRSILTKVAEQGLPGEHHFYISFNTLAPGVAIAPRLVQKYPGEMTIVLQHRFWDLLVQADRFEVKLTFDSIRERLIIPFAAVRVFFDPSVPYGLQFDEPVPDGRAASADGATASRGEVMGFSGGRNGGRASGRTQGERGERPQPERKKITRKAKTDATADGDLLESGDVTERTRPGETADVKTGDVKVGAPPPPVADTGSGPKTVPPKTGPRLVETANDSAKVVSLDQFRKK